ncbi:MAG: hypothetical protein ACKVH5_01570 [Fidelibacterota bacterium]|jgi:hypothetical protein|nr:hypothetical protein [Candidatus Neomarinimicrobiota bacterium]
MKKFLISICLFSILIGQDWGSQPGGFLRMGMTARSIAMGSGFTAEMDLSFATFHNPAWAAFLTHRQIGSSYSNLSLDRRVAGTSIAMPLPPTAGVGIGWVYAGVTDIQGRYSTGMKSSMMQTGENAIYFTFAQRILNWISFGANVKILRYDLPITESDQLTGSGIGFDIGLLIKTGKFNTIGITIQDLSSNYQWDTGDVYAEGRLYKDEFPTIYRIGSRLNHKGLIVVGDIGLITDHESYTGIIPRLGVEYGFLEQYYFRGGYGNGRKAFGIGYEYGLFKPHDSYIDYAFSMDWATQSAHTISYAFRF